MTSIESEQASTMKYGGNFDDLISEAIHNAVGAVDDLSDRLVAKLRDHPSGARVLLKSAHRGNDPCGSPRRLGSPGEPRRSGSPEKSTLHLGVVAALPSIQLSQPALDLRQENQALDSIFQRGIRW